MIEMNRRQALVAIGAFAALAACGSGDDKKKSDDFSANRDGAMPDYGPGKQFKAAAPLTFTMLYNNHPFYPIKNDWLFWSELTKRTGVTIQPNVVPLSDYEEKRSLIIGAGDAPMIIPKTYPAQETAFVASGAILPVSDYIDLMPNFKDRVAKWNLQPDLDTLRQEDGRFYLLPGLHQDFWVDYSLAVRKDVLDKLGLQIPGTWDELRTVMKALKEEYPDSYPLSDRWGQLETGANLFNIIGTSYGAPGGWGYGDGTKWDATAGKFAFTGAMEGYKQMLQYLHTLAEEKLLDPESFTQSDEQAIQKLVSGKSFMISSNAQTLVNEYRPPLSKANPKAELVKIPVPIGPLGPIKYGNGNTRLENGVMISKKARDSKNFVAMMQFIDWLWYSDEGQLFAKWGVEGVTYTKDASGRFKLTDDVDFVGLNPKAPKHLQKDFGFSNGVFAYGGSTEILQSTFSEEEIAFQKVMNARNPVQVPPPHPLSDEEREQATLWQAPLKDHVAQNSLKFVLGKRDFGEWDAYVAELDGKNMSAYVNLVNGAYERYKKAHG
ncbi:sugar ABC transporter substrate-binding protein [Sphaerisporangium melleum]|uniref:Sugar ABC transporter substrate-binding protein n=1 Tax=Sphaerisporangium melleum TaxID=321316 RepID=A0A917RNA0_9ACTN|nr:extracellular solute-binding protein [Sphaerisporangium melleum]GGL15734.1 sugar ABC transporter substrate-binding protein [Sphaerisporangium melleum]GII69648.1 sugar ABC transporter substrate-binding protein [Sphaerisporangium melleum]